MAEFHHDFWIAVATAGPVLLVASTLTWVQTSSAAVDQVLLRNSRAKLRPIGRKWRVIPVFTAYGSAYRYGAAAVLLETLMFMTGLTALSTEEDQHLIFPTLVGSLLAAGCFLGQTFSTLFMKLDDTDRRIDLLRAEARGSRRPRPSPRGRPDPE